MSSSPGLFLWLQVVWISTTIKSIHKRSWNRHFYNKKVLLRDRRRRTARGIACPLGGGGGGLPHVLSRGTPLATGLTGASPRKGPGTRGVPSWTGAHLRKHNHSSYFVHGRSLQLWRRNLKYMTADYPLLTYFEPLPWRRQQTKRCGR